MTSNFFRFWYENPSTFKPQQLDQIKQTSLARIICDNGDDVRSITHNVFLNMKREDEIGNNKMNDCSEIPSVSLEMWAGKLSFCADVYHFLPNLNNLIDYPLLLTKVFQSIFLLECREDIENEVVHATRNKRDSNEQQNNLFETETASKPPIKVCIEYNGNIRRDGESWIHNYTRESVKTCAKCNCNVRE